MKISCGKLAIKLRNSWLIENNGYLPDKFASVDYLAAVKEYDVRGGAIVSGSFQAFDQTYLLNALQELGKNYVGVTQFPVDTSDDEIKKVINSLDSESEIETAQEIFLDDEPDDDFEND